MNDTVAVGLITAVSTLGAVGFTGAVSGWATRSQQRHQAVLAAADRSEQRAARRRERRRDAYLHFLSRADEAYRRLDERWLEPPPAAEPGGLDPVYLALRALDEAHNRVLLEGPDEVAEQAELVVASINDEYHGQRRLLAGNRGAEVGVAHLRPGRHATAIATREQRRMELMRVARPAIGGDLPSS